MGGWGGGSSIGRWMEQVIKASRDKRVSDKMRNGKPEGGMWMEETGRREKRVDKW